MGDGEGLGHGVVGEVGRQELQDVEFACSERFDKSGGRSAVDDRRNGTRVASQPVTAADGSVVEQRTEDRGIVQERLTVAGVRRDFIASVSS